MGSSNNERACADEIADVTENLGSLSWVVRDAASVLEVLGISEKDGAGDLVADVGWEVLDSGCGESSTLTVPSGDELRGGALGVGEVEQRSHLSDGGPGCSSRESVVSKGSAVCTANLEQVRLSLVEIMGKHLHPGSRLHLGQSYSQEQKQLGDLEYPFEFVSPCHKSCSENTLPSFQAQ